MTETIMYAAKDGTLFSSRAVCAQHEALIDRCEMIMMPLGENVRDEGYVQHDPTIVLQVKGALMEMAKTVSSHEVFSMDPAKVHPMSIAGRIICDSDVMPLRMAWNRLCCIDSDGREWQQPYYALNPGTGKNMRLR